MTYNPNLSLQRVKYRVAANAYEQAAELRERGYVPQFCASCGVGPFIRVEARKYPDLCLDCADAAIDADV